MTWRIEPRERRTRPEEQRLVDSYKFPETNEDHVIPVVFGTKRISSPHLCWYGDLSISQSVPRRRDPRAVGLEVSSPIPYWSGGNYKIGMHLAYCYGPVDNITKIIIGDIVVWEGTSTGGTLTIEKLLGDAEKGGIFGDVEVFTGAKAQDFSTYLSLALGSYGGDHPNYFGVLSLVAESPTIGKKVEGQSIDVKPWEVVAKRIHLQPDGTTQWYDAKAEIDGDMNPAHIIRELFTSVQYGLGYDSSFIDETSFQAAADTLYTEGLGLSFKFDRENTVEEMLDEVKRSMRGEVFLNRTTGKINLKLIRNDYVLGSLLTIDNDNLKSVESIEKNTNDELPNTVKVKYYNKSEFSESSVIVRDTALYTISGRQVVQTVELFGITTPENASAAASNILIDNAFSKFVIKITCDKEANTLNIADVFIFNVPDYGISSTVFRVLDISPGSFSSREVKITAIQEESQPFESIFDPPPATEWTPVSTTPVNCPVRVLQECPYYILRTLLTENDVATIDPEKTMVIYTGSKPSNDTINLSVMISGVELVERAIPAKSGELSGALTKVSTSMTCTVENLEEGEYIQIDYEIMFVSSIVDNGDGTFTMDILRGCMDTVPATHSDESDVISLIYSVTDGLLKDAGIITGKLAPTTLQGTLPWDDATGDQVSTLYGSGRFWRPIPPGNVRFKKQYWPASVAGDLVISWEPRSRFYTDETVGFFDTGLESEEDVTYSVYVYDDGGLLVVQEDDITDTVVTITMPGTGTYTFEIFSVRDGVSSYQHHYHELYYDSTPDYLILEDDDPAEQERILEDDSGGDQIRLIE